MAHVNFTCNTNKALQIKINKSEIQGCSNAYNTMMMLMVRQNAFIWDVK